MSDAIHDDARALLAEFKADRYTFGWGATEADRLRPHVDRFGRRLVAFAGKTAHAAGLVERFCETARSAGKDVVAVHDAARPNAPIEDVRAMADALTTAGEVDGAVVIGGGSAIDAMKAAVVLQGLGGDLEDYYGVGLVSAAIEARNARLLPVLAVMTAASSAAHLTRYSNVTNLELGQKKLLIDDAIVPPQAIFDYAVTTSMSESFTLDGALDGISHSLEVYLGATGGAEYPKIERIALTGVELIVTRLARAASDPDDVDARISLGLGTDLGGYAIMVGGTSGAHLNSFSLVDVLSHGRAVSILNPYYVVFFAPACESQLRRLAALYARAGYLSHQTDGLTGRDLGLAVADAMLAFAHAVGFPTRLADVPGFGDEHVQRCLSAAKNPQLRSKLENMPVPMTPECVDEYMGAVLDAAVTGQPERVKSLA